MREIKRIVIHVSDSPDTMDIGVDTIRKWHTDPKPKGNGWKDVGYHAVIRRDGTAELGRPMDQAGAHTAGYNKDTLGICWVGRTKPTAIQYQSLLNVVRVLVAAHGLTKQDVYGHRELDPGKMCPCLDMNKLRGEL
jgi:N-acetyl-anhydromuramyl-L-alanine amidase AmpD